MLRNYFKSAWRNLVKGRMHSLINVVGLSVGMAVAMLIGLWLYDELSFNKNFGNYSRIAQVEQNVVNNGEVQTWTSVPYPLAEELRSHYGSDFKSIAMSVDVGPHDMTLGNKKLKQTGGYFEKGICDILSLRMISGSTSSLKDPGSLLLSVAAAKACFGNEDPMNKMIQIDDHPPVKVTGIYEDIARNSTFGDVNFISTWDFFSSVNDVKSIKDPWRPNFVELYVQLNDHADVQAVSMKIRDAKLKKVNEQLQKKKPALFLHPMSKWHLYSEFKNGVNVGGAIQYVWMFGTIGSFVLLLACINFMNLSTARSEKRAKEVGIRKTIGSRRKQLVWQFFTESLLTVLFAFVLATLLMQLLLPFFNSVSGKKLEVLWSNPYFWMIGACLTLFTALVSGSYPAFYLSSFIPVKVLKGTFKAGRLASIPRKLLVILQFTVSVVLITGTIVVYKQIQFAKNQPIGYNRNNLVAVSSSKEIHEHFAALQQTLMQARVITGMTEAGNEPTSGSGSSSGFSWRGKDPNLSIDFSRVGVSYDYGKTVDWKISAGRDFSRDFISDSSAFVLNEAAAKFMGFQNPVGETVYWFDKPYKVIGVAKDMIMESPYEAAKPTVFFLSTEVNNVVLLKINPLVSASGAMAKIGAVIKQYNPDRPFEYRFESDEFAKKFNNEERVGKIATFFAVLAVFISCLGIFGMASFAAEQRVKEIGIRKVLGASVFGLWQLLSSNFILMVLISLLIATPLAYYFMHNWLEHYQYRTGLSWWIFAAAGAGALLITLLAVSFQTIRAAMGSPVKSLRSE